jgi:SAM-dependent methyltransferase
MAGGFEAALAQGTRDLENVLDGGGLAVDLGAGFGMHAIPLARAGWEVVAIDSSEFLLAELAAFAGGLPIRPVQADLRHFTRYLHGRRPDLVLCMGDTLTHLADVAEVKTLLHDVAASLAPSGRFVATFRDYTRAPTGNARFVQVRADEAKILVCFIEAAGQRVIVHDLLHEKRGAAWTTRVSAYPKLRLAPAAVQVALARAGLESTVGPGPRGMVCVRAMA